MKMSSLKEADAQVYIYILCTWLQMLQILIYIYQIAVGNENVYTQLFISFRSRSKTYFLFHVTYFKLTGECFL
jgi:hypothetical protein